MKRVSIIASLALVAFIGTPLGKSAISSTYSGGFRQVVKSSGSAVCFGVPDFTVEDIQVKETDDGIELASLEPLSPSRSGKTYRGNQMVPQISGGDSKMNVRIRKRRNGYSIRYTELIYFSDDSYCHFDTIGHISPS